MLRQFHRSSPWRNQWLPTPGVILDLQHPRARGLLGLWVPHTSPIRGQVNDTGANDIDLLSAIMRDLSPHRRDAVFSPGSLGADVPGQWVIGHNGVGFYIVSGQNGALKVVPKHTTDWDLQGAFTVMCRVRLNTLSTADINTRAFCGRSDGAGAPTKKWFWAWAEAGYAGVTPANRLFLHNVPQPTGEDTVATVDWNPATTEIYTVALTRAADKTVGFFVDGYRVGDPVASTLALSIPDSLTLNWGWGEDFGVNIPGTFFWMKAWERDLSPREVLAEHTSPWEMLRLPMNMAGGSAARGARVRAFWY